MADFDLGRAAKNLSNRALSSFTLEGLHPEDKVSPNFTVRELLKSETADRNDINNFFEHEAHLQASVYLARNVLQPVRNKFGSYTPNSVYRSQALERELKSKPHTWMSGSQHAKGEACDIEIIGVSTLELSIWIAKNLETYDQIICECYDERKGPNSGWVHVSIKQGGGNRKQMLSYLRHPDTGRFIYIAGLRSAYGEAPMLA